MESNHPPPLKHSQRPSAKVAISSPVPDFSYLRDYVRPAGHMFPAYGGASQTGGPNYQWMNDHHRHPIGLHVASWRQIEKEKIREEIIAEEIVRRRVLEAEVRRELMIERELAMQRGGDGSYYTSHWKSMIVEPDSFPALPEPQKMEGTAHGERTEISTLVRHEFGILETSSKRISEPRSLEFVTPSDTIKEKQKIILLAKPEPKKCSMIGKAEVLPSPSAKRKAEEVFKPVGASELTSAGGSVTKKVKEWSCALCQVMSTSERALNEHLQGKKHKVKEASLRKNGKNFSIGLYPKTNDMPNKLAQIASSPCFEKGVEKNTDLTLKKNKAQACRIRRTREQKNFKFWCEMCQIGAFSENVMETHKKGKKHLTLLLRQNTVSKPSTQIMQVKNEIYLTEDDGKVVEVTAYENSAPIIDEVKLQGYQKVAGQDKEDVSSKGFCLVADEVELEGNVVSSKGLCLIADEVEIEGNQNEAVKVVEDTTSESLDPVTDKVELEGEKKEACENDADTRSEGSDPLIEVELECDQKEESITDVDNSD